jgi:hypothetical protein
MNIQAETWKVIPQGHYEVSDLGRVRRIGGAILNPTPNTGGYLSCSVCIGNDLLDSPRN